MNWWALRRGARGEQGHGRGGGSCMRRKKWRCPMCKTSSSRGIITITITSTSGSSSGSRGTE